MNSSTNANNKWWTLLAVSMATFMLLLDVTIVNVALASIQHDLKASFSDLQWVVDAYALTLAAFLLTWGSLADALGRRRIFLLGVTVFTVASLSCALSINPLMLNVSRAIQGFGSGAMLATGLALIAQEFHGRDRGTAFGVWGAVTGGAVAIGPLAGGALTDAFGWESIFYINLPVGVAALALTYWKVVDHHEHLAGKIDLVGFVTFSGSLFLLVYGLVRGNSDDWSSFGIAGSLVGAALLMAAFWYAELKQRKPMFDLSLLRNPTFLGASVAAFALSASIFSLYFYISLYFQGPLEHSPFETGLRFLPPSLISFFVAAMAGKASAHLPVKGLMGVGLACVALGTALMAWIVDAGSTWTALLPGMCIAGFGIGLTNPPLASTAVGVVEPRKSGVASGINATFRQVGIATGIAGLGALFQHNLHDDLASRLSALDNATVGRVGDAIATGQLDNALASSSEESRALIATAAQESFVHAFDVIGFTAAGIALAASIIVFVTVRAKDFAAVRQPTQSAPPAP